MWNLVVAGLVAATGIPHVAHSAEIPAGHEGFKQGVQPFFENHCIRCHGPKKSKGKLTLHQLNGIEGDEDAMEQWETILEMIMDGEMPPDDEPQPDDDQRDAVAKWIEQGIKQVAKEKKTVSHGPIARRLTNFEYQNTMRDLVGVDIDLIRNLPNDPIKPYEFNNSAELMRLGPEQIDRYLENARRVMASVIVDPKQPEVKKTRREWKREIPEKRTMSPSEVGVYSNYRGSAAQGVDLTDFPTTGPFRIRFKASAALSKGATEVPLRWIMGESIQVNSATRRVRPVGTVLLKSETPQVFELRGRIENFPVQTGRKRKQRSLPDAISITPQNLFDNGTLNDDTSFHKTENVKFPRAVIEWVEFEGPVYDTWPPEHHTRILFDSPLRETDPKRYVAEVLHRFMSRAYRRPATNTEVDRFMKIYDLLEPEMGSFEATMRETLSMVLVTPQFLMHTIADGENIPPEYELASKLSYFLWGSMPDEELLALAANQSLPKPAVIEQQAKRMLADARSGDFIQNFTMQWLSLEKMKTVPINKDLFPRFLYYVSHGERAGTEVPYRPTIRDHMITETVGYIGQLIEHNASITHLIDSGQAYLNQPLAAHYGIDGVKGHQHQMVKMKPEDKLGGLLTQGSVLIGNGTGTAPHPIYRAVWLREAILGDEVAPPPADVPALTDTVGDSAEKALTIKDLLAQHRQQESCKDCHARLDPWGIPFEQYNAIGKFQAKVPKQGVRVERFNPKNHVDLKGYLTYLDSINTEQIDADSRLPNGPKVENMDDLQAYLLKHRIDDVAENMARRLLTYGLGRHLTYQDRSSVDTLLADSKAKQYQMRDMIVAVCKSDLFLNTTAP